MKVANFIRADKREWDMEEIKEVLSDEDVGLVARIPLSRKSTPDRLIWRDSINQWI